MVAGAAARSAGLGPAWTDTFAATAVAALGAALVCWLAIALQPPSRHRLQAAREIDRRGGLDDLVVSALTLSRHQGDPRWRALLEHRARRALDELRVDALLPPRLPAAVAAAAALSVVALGLGTIRSPLEGRAEVLAALDPAVLDPDVTSSAPAGDGDAGTEPSELAALELAERALFEQLRRSAPEQDPRAAADSDSRRIDGVASSEEGGAVDADLDAGPEAEGATEAPGEGEPFFEELEGAAPSEAPRRETAPSGPSDPSAAEGRTGGDPAAMAEIEDGDEPPAIPFEVPLEPSGDPNRPQRAAASEVPPTAAAAGAAGEAAEELEGRALPNAAGGEGSGPQGLSEAPLGAEATELPVTLELALVQQVEESRRVEPDVEQEYRQSAAARAKVAEAAARVVEGATLVARTEGPLADRVLGAMLLEYLPPSPIEEPPRARPSEPREQP